MGDSVQVAPLEVRRQGGFFSGLPWWQGAALLLLIAWLYGSTLAHLFAQWMNDPYFQHGIFVPAFALFVLWQNRHQLKLVSSAPSWTGLPLVVCALIVLMLGVMGAELFLSRVSLLLLLSGLIILFQGWPFFRAVLFPWAILILMIPIPTIILLRFTFPLQILASKLASGLLPLAGVPVLREGNIIQLPAMPLEVAEACSGIRSLLSLVTLAIIYGYLMESRKWVRILLVVSAVPIAVAANSLRIVGTGLLVQYWDPEKAEGFFHTFSGWLIFVVSLIMLFALHGAITRIWKNSSEVKST
ncbi:MAG: exosortase/archaeosortase family protein [Terriglobales bacterium]